MPGFLHQAAPVRQVMGQRLHPGGPELTRRGLELAAVSPGMRVLDAGCGPGGSLELLRGWGHTHAVGLDRDPSLLAEAVARGLHGLVAGDLARLPLADGCLDAVLCECAWNLSDRREALAEFWRVLRPGGRLIVSDMYLRGSSGGAWPLDCCFSGASDEGRTCELISSAGFRVKCWEDHSAALRQLAGELIFAHGSLDAFWQLVTGDEAAAARACRLGRQSLPGLFLCIAAKE